MSSEESKHQASTSSRALDGDVESQRPNNGQKPSEDNERHRSQSGQWTREFISWWAIGAGLLVIPLVLSTTRFRTVHIGDVHLHGFIYWLSISWLGLLVSYLIAWTIAFLWYHLCEKGRLDIDDWDTFLVDLRHSVMFLLWGFISWGTVPLLCEVDHHHCTSGWTHAFYRALLATLVVDILFFAKNFALEWLLTRTCIDFLRTREKELDASLYAMTILLFEEDSEKGEPFTFWKRTSSKIWYLRSWVGYMRKWSKVQRNGYDDLDDDDLDDDDSTEVGKRDERVSKALPKDQPSSMRKSLGKMSWGAGNKKDYNILRRGLKSKLQDELKKPELQKCPPLQPNGSSNTQTGTKNFYKSLWQRVLHFSCQIHCVWDQQERVCIHQLVQWCKCLPVKLPDDPAPDLQGKDKGKKSAGLYHCGIVPASKEPKSPLAEEGIESSKSSCQCRMVSRSKRHKPPRPEDGCQGACNTKMADENGDPIGLCENQANLLVKHILESNPGGPSRQMAIAINQFGNIDALWKVLDRKGEDFVSFTALGWMVEDVGDSMKEVIGGWKNLMLVVHELNLVLSSLLLIAIGLIYGTLYRF